MPRRFIACSAAFSVFLAPAAAAQSEAAPVAPAAGAVQPEREPVYDESAAGADQIAAALTKAKQNNRRVLIQWGANWCGWCILLHDYCNTNAAVGRKLNYEYDVVHIDIGRLDKHQDLVEKYGAKIDGVPYWTILDAEGAVVAHRETGSLENPAGSDPPYDEEKVLAVLTEHQAPYQSAAALLEGAVGSARSEGKAAFVRFGAPWCGWCHRLDAFLARPDIAPLFERRFVGLKIDTERTIGGGEMLAEMRDSPRGGIPWFAFLDGDGNQMVSSSSEGENIGYPAAPEEAAAFVRMLRRVKPAFTDDELGFIERELVASVKVPGR